MTVIVMYHYVRDVDKTPYPKIHARSIAEFEGQLDYLEKNFKIISLDECMMGYLGGEPHPDNACVLTFDDGLKDHYTNVFPILKKRGLRAAFYPVAEPLEKNIVLPVHKAHFLFAKLGTENFATEFNEVLRTRYLRRLVQYYASAGPKKEPKYRWDDNLTANLKYSIATLPDSVRRNILTIIFSKYFDDEKTFSQELYMSQSDMMEMAMAGMVFGNHTYNHPNLTTIRKWVQLRELEKPMEIFKKQLPGVGIWSVSYPYGGYNDATIAIMKSMGLPCGLTTDVGVNDMSTDPLKMKRVDTNDLPLKA